MPISSKTPPTERAPKTVTGSRACPGSSLAGEISLQFVLQSGILDQLQDAVFTTDLHGIITSCNQGVDRYGYVPKDLVGRNVAQFYGVEQQTFLATRAMAAVLEKGRFESELRCRTKSGQDVDVHLCLTLLRDSNAAPAGILGFSIDITEKKVLETAPSTQAPFATEAVPLARREIDGTAFLIASPIIDRFTRTE